MAWRETVCKITVLACIILALSLGMAVPVKAHNIEVFAYSEGERVFVEGFYGGGTKAGSAKVEVFDSAGRKVIDGITDTEGIFSFAIPVDGDLEIVVLDDMGHRDTFVLKGETNRSSSGETHDETAQKGEESKMKGAFDEAILEGMITRKTEPIMRELGEMRKMMEKPSFRDMAGGLGYIVGLAGLLFFLLGRKRRGGR